MKNSNIKSRTSIRSALLISAALFTTSASANNLGNPGFESGGGWNTGNQHAIVTGNARSGSKALQLTSNGATNTTFSNYVSVNEGDEYVLSSYVKAQNLVAGPNGSGDTPILLMRFRDANNNYVLNHNGKQASGFRWAPYPKGANGTYGYTNAGMSMRFEIPNKGRSVQVGIRTWTVGNLGNTAGKTWWDDLSLTKVNYPDRGTKTGTYQAENSASNTRSFVSTVEKEFTGSGYLDVTANNAEITWNNVAGGGQRVISVRYSWEGFIQPIRVILNGTEVGNQKPAPTGRRGIYATTDFVVNMPNNNNTVKLIVGKKGGDLGNPMIDKIDVYVKSGTGGGGGGGGSTEPPAAPGNLQASDNTFTNMVAVTWNGSSGADSYQVQRNTAQSGTGAQRIGGTITTTLLDDTSAVAGTTYFYRVRACSDANGCGSYSSWDQGTRMTSGGGGGSEPPATPGNVQASDSTFTSKVAISWNASSGADDYQVQRNTSAAGSGAQQIGNPTGTSLDDTSAQASTNYYYRVRACSDADGCSSYSPWDQGSRAASGGGGGGGNSGGLSGVVSNSTANTDISIDAADFVKLGDPLVRMANVDPQILAIAGINGTDGNTYRAGRMGHQWMNGTPLLTGDNSRNGLRVFNNGKGLSVSAIAGTTPRTLSLWITGKGQTDNPLNATLTASLSDASSANFTTTFTAGTNKIGKRVVLTYVADSDGELITVNLIKNSGHFAAIDAVSLTGGDGGTVNLPPAIASVANQTITAGDSLHIDLQASDPEGSDVTFSISDDLPGSAVVLTNSGNGIGAIDWQSSAGDAGNFTITVTAVDAQLKSASREINVRVESQASGGNGVLQATANLVTAGQVTLSGSFLKFAPAAGIDFATNASGEQPFSQLIRLGGALASPSTTSGTRYSYSNAIPTDANRIRGGNRIFDSMPVGMRVEIDSDSRLETTKLYVTTRDALVRITFTLADASAPQKVIEIDHRNEAMATFVLEVDHQAGANGQTLVVEGFVAGQTAAAPLGFLQFDALQQ